MNWVEAVGYLGSLLVAVSLTMSSLVRLRWLNLAGAVARLAVAVVRRRRLMTVADFAALGAQGPVGPRHRCGQLGDS